MFSPNHYNLFNERACSEGKDGLEMKCGEMRVEARRAMRAFKRRRKTGVHKNTRTRHVGPYSLNVFLLLSEWLNESKVD